MSTTTDKPTVEEIRARNKKASEVVNAICNGRQKWTMSVPAQPESDPDLVISAALRDIDFLLAKLNQIEAKHESQLDDACAEIGEIRGCEKCDLCEDHHG